MRGICSMAVRRVLAELAADYARRSSYSVTVEAVGGVDAERRIEAGERFDFAVLAARAIERLAADRRVDPRSRVDLAHSEMAIAVASGAPQPPIDSAAAVRDALLTARRIAYSTGPSGRHLLALLDQWGVRDALAPRLVEARPGVAVAALIAQGEADIGMQQLSEMLDVPGVDVVGPLPHDIQQLTVFSGALLANAVEPDAARAFLAYCAAPETAAVKRAHGMAA
jgi:molybdate transport system substrate-binding protein